ncbi:bifunctional DNA-formamidopyrimidine glycosylase/DNA-(apurinic or apyrimidinic site) lyase [Candidatus Pelagibacter bacterium]|jgi:formamidopyrimidine-DNA glycosylase|nr:bifunctional DNA-formamidopyrimidine glycosylase/DNA-(apurinic or apyrimidinic site) lyase [Candidatus Pelagibacter bacterium]MDA8676601.1 bifunctional DNA-formamidopyrimidine glycosylase/DNA-(apurinic or apyrimidinic site) lyase [Candidatus Pelagibacter bacterium]MDA8764308.1 bifunctional DNA-formamidopyrimidine glycosylase/DNA-(apurinic or apyrimidinic site) lyase [Candidatus Pelagibacter bacterium]
MPELPEVEVVKRSLIRKVKNLIIQKVNIKDSKLRYHIDKNKFRKITGLRIKKIERKSKFLLFFLSKNFIMMVHLGMTGKFFFVDRKNTKLKTSFYYNIDYKKEQKYDRVEFILNKNQKLIYNDVRKFGFIKLLSNKEYKDNFHLIHLGPEPLKNTFNYTYFKNYIKGRSRVIKDILMDQKFVSGLGNIYANEILFLSKVKPSRKVKNLKEFELKKIINFTKEVLKNAIELGGSSIKDFSSSNGKKGSFQQHFNVYGKKGATCTNTTCRSIIVKSSISNRSTFFCDNCQK